MDTINCMLTIIINWVKLSRNTLFLLSRKLKKNHLLTSPICIIRNDLIPLTSNN